MTDYLSEYRIRVRNRADSADLLVVTSVRGDAAPNYPYIQDPPRGDGTSFNPLTGESMCASYTGTIVDAEIGSSQRVVSSKLEDVTEKLQLGYLKAYVERRIDGGAWSVLCVGFLTVLRLTTAVTWEFTIQEASRVQGGVELFNATSSTTIADFLSLWPNRGCLFGGPIKGSWLTLQDRGGFEMKVARSFDSGGTTRDVYMLTPVRYYGPPSWKANEGWGAMADIVNQAAAGLPRTSQFNYGAVSLSTIADAYSNALAWPGLIVLIDDVPWRPIPPVLTATDVDATWSADHGFWNLLSKRLSGNNGNDMLFVYHDNQAALAIGSTVRVRCLTVLPSEVSPIYFDGHPVDLLTTALTAANLDYNAAGVTALKEKMGTGLRLSRRITASEQMGQMLRQCVYSLGVAQRVNSAGEIVPFSTRIFENTPPTKTITDAHLKQEGQKLVFEQDASAGLQRLTFRQTIFTLMADTPDGVVENDNEITLLNGEADALLTGTVEIDIPGMLRVDPAAKTAVDEAWLRPVAEQFFDRFGRGNRALEYELARGDGTTDADTLVLGEEVLIDISELPNHNYRLGDNAAIAPRAMQVARIDELPESRLVRWEDSGPNSQPYGTAPTLAAGLSTDLPRSVATVTVTNAAALNADSAKVQIQMAVTTGAAPAAGDYSDVYGSAAGAIPTTAIRLSAATPGRTVYLRARAIKSGERPSAWSVVVNQALSALNVPTGLAASSVAGDGSLEDLSWAIGAGAADCPVNVWIRNNGQPFSAAKLDRTLPPGSTRYRLEGLTPGNTYVASVEHVDVVTGDTSTEAEVTFTTVVTTRALGAPLHPVGFSGMQVVS
jgi:hypothetical protein